MEISVFIFFSASSFLVAFQANVLSHVAFETAVTLKASMSSGVRVALVHAVVPTTGVTG